MDKARLFVLGIPFAPSTPAMAERASLGFVTKVIDLCAMMHRAGHRVVHLGVEGSEVECTENIDCIDKDAWTRLFGNIRDPQCPLFQETEKEPFATYFRKWCKRAKLAILERCDRDTEAIVCVTFGGPQWGAVKGVEQFIVETGIGYWGGWAQYRTYESYACLHVNLGREGKQNEPHWYWPVIPPCIDVAQYPFAEKRGDKLLYFGRINESKGVKIAVDAAKAAGRQIILCGHGDPKPFLDKHVTVLPSCNNATRNQLMSEAAAVFVPTRYAEPFGRVVIEANACGAPVITTDWGAFAENVREGVTGFRCRTFADFVRAAKDCESLKPQACRDWVASEYSFARVAGMYTRYFASLFMPWESDLPVQGVLRTDSAALSAPVAL